MLASDVLVFLTCLIGTCTHLSSAVIGNETELFNSLLKDYDKNASPAKFTGKPTNVKIGLYFLSFEINNDNSDLTFTGYLRMNWDDPRLKYPQEKLSSAKNAGEGISLSDFGWEKIWIPDVFVRNAISSRSHEMVTRNRLIKLRPSGTIWGVMKVTVVVVCEPEHPRRYPFETLVCNLFFESFSHTTETMTISSLEHGFDLSPQFVRGFLPLDTKRSDCSQNYTTGSYPCLEFTLILQRVSSFVSRVCIPSALIVIISWISFWIDKEATTARLMIGFLSLIGMTLVYTLSAKSPAFVSYTTLLDVWLLVSFVFIFASILEYFVILILSRKGVCALPSEGSSEVKTSKEAEHGKRAVGWIDWISRIVFPVAFLVFIIVFFCL